MRDKRRESTVIETLAGPVEVYADCRVYVYDMILAGEPLFERDIHARMLSRADFDKEQWARLRPDERELSLTIDLAVAKARITKLEDERKRNRFEFVLIVATIVAIWMVSWFWPSR